MATEIWEPWVVLTTKTLHTITAHLLYLTVTRMLDTVEHSLMPVKRLVIRGHRHPTAQHHLQWLHPQLVGNQWSTAGGMCKLYRGFLFVLGGLARHSTALQSDGVEMELWDYGEPEHGRKAGNGNLNIIPQDCNDDFDGFEPI